MKEPKVQVGILFEPQIKFILLTPYHINGEEVSGKQVVTYDNGHILWQGHSYDELLFEPLHEKSDAFAKKLGFCSIDGENFTITVNDLMNYFSME